MDKTFAENISEKINQILWGKSFVDVLDSQDIEKTFILRSLSIRESNYLDFIYEKELRIAKEIGILTQDQLKKLFYVQNVWGEEEEKSRLKLETELHLLGNQLKISEFNTLRRKKIEKRIKEIKLALDELNKQEISLFSVSAENRAEEVRRRIMIYLFTETIDEEPYWSSQEDFLQSTDNILLNNLIITYYKNNIYSESLLRKIARSGEWRFRWIASKHGEQLFGKSVSQWSEMQNMLVYWSEYYDSIYESIDRPSDYIIEDDIACDAWVVEQNKKITQQRSGVKQKKQGQKLNHNEQFVVVNKDDKEAIKKVQDMNPETVRNQLKQEFEQIKKSNKRVKEWYLGSRKDFTPRKGKK